MKIQKKINIGKPEIGTFLLQPKHSKFEAGILGF